MDVGSEAGIRSGRLGSGPHVRVVVGGQKQTRRHPLLQEEDVPHVGHRGVQRLLSLRHEADWLGDRVGSEEVLLCRTLWGGGGASASTGAAGLSCASAGASASAAASGLSSASAGATGMSYSWGSGTGSASSAALCGGGGASASAGAAGLSSASAGASGMSSSWGASTRLVGAASASSDPSLRGL